MNTPPRLFISYSWSTPGHEQWVIDLATELVNSGVDVILDKWNLREGHDSVAFMEKMVTDPSISKVVLICDQVYASKADGRSGGVGTETQIISAEVYAKQDQDKFVAVIAERDSEGKPYLPTYYKSRIYVDLSESDRYAENFEKLLRWIFDKPLYVKPEIGKPPSFIVEPDAPVLGTSALAKRVVEGFKTDKGYVRGALDEYLTVFSENLEKFRILGSDGEPDDRIVKSAMSFLLVEMSSSRFLLRSRNTRILNRICLLFTGILSRLFLICLVHHISISGTKLISTISSSSSTSCFFMRSLYFYAVSILNRRLIFSHSLTMFQATQNMGRTLRCPTLFFGTT